MKYRVWDESCKESNEDDICYLRLRQEDDDVFLMAVDRNGEMIDRGNLLMIDCDTRCVILRPGVNDSISIKSNFIGEVIIVDGRSYHEFKKQEALDKLGHMIKERMLESDKEQSTMQ
jgi:hypothetical protein